MKFLMTIVSAAPPVAGEPLPATAVALLPVVA
jgi:hypothetical protein